VSVETERPAAAARVAQMLYRSVAVNVHVKSVNGRSASRARPVVDLHPVMTSCMCPSVTRTAAAAAAAAAARYRVTVQVQSRRRFSMRYYARRHEQRR